MGTTITDEQIQELAATAQPFSIALLWWGPQRHRDGADAIELEHRRRMVSLHADGVIPVLCPGNSDELAAVAIMNLPPEEARETMAGDPCVQAEMIRVEVHPGLGFPGDTVPG